MYSQPKIMITILPEFSLQHLKKLFTHMTQKISIKMHAVKKLQTERAGERVTSGDGRH